MLKNFQISKSIIVFIKINFFLIVSLNIVAQNNTIIGIDKTEEYLPLIIDKNIAIVSNHTSQFIKESNSIHLVDSLLKLIYFLWSSNQRHKSQIYMHHKLYHSLHQCIMN